MTQVHTNVGEPAWPGVMRLYYTPDVGIVRQESMWGDSVWAAYDLVDWQVTPYPYQ